MTRTRVLQEIRRMRFKNSMCSVEGEGTASSFRGMARFVERQGLPLSLYTDRGRGQGRARQSGTLLDNRKPVRHLFRRKRHLFIAE